LKLVEHAELERHSHFSSSPCVAHPALVRGDSPEQLDCYIKGDQRAAPVKK
jgi:hypothetical protein